MVVMKIKIVKRMVVMVMMTTTMMMMMMMMMIMVIMMMVTMMMRSYLADKRGFLGPHPTLSERNAATRR